MAHVFNPKARIFNPKATAACEKVFNTVELLDNVLGNLPLKNIFGVQRTSKVFYRHIHGDTLAAKRLYLSPKSHQAELTCVLRDSRLVNNSFYTLPFRYRTMMNPAGRYVRVAISLSEGRYEVQSWREMFLTQPPVTELWIHDLRDLTLAQGKEFNLPARGSMSRGRGITLRDLMDVARTMRVTGYLGRWLAFSAYIDENGESSREYEGY